MGKCKDCKAKMNPEKAELTAKLAEVSENYRSLYGAILRYAYPPEGKVLECLLCGGRGMGGASVRHTPECPTKGPREPGSTIGYLEKRLNGE
jgi:hypothetical protein